MRAAVIQLNAALEPAISLERATAAVEAAARDGAELVVLPEKWLLVGDGAALGAVAEPLDGPLVRTLRSLAGDLRIELVAGSIPESPAPGDADRRPWNTSLHVRPDGTVAAAYRKVHLFDAVVAGHRYRESAGERAGEQLVVSRTADPALTLGLTVCFDLRFPALRRALADAGATVLTIPAAFTLATTRDHWEVLVRARAIETGSWVLAANQAGDHPDGTTSGGQSLIADPWGQIVARAPESGPAQLIWELDGAAVQRAREALPTGLLQRPEVYAAAADRKMRPSAVSPSRGTDPSRSAP